MKNRLFPIGIGLCFVLLIGIGLLRSLTPRTEAPIEKESVQESAKPNELPQTENATRSDKTEATDPSSLPSMDDIDMEEYKAALRSKDPERIKAALGPEFAARIDAGMEFMEEKMGDLEVGEFPDFNLQEYLSIIMGEDGPEINWEEISQRAFREHFPEGEPEDYEAEMAARIHEIVADTPGDFRKVLGAVTMEFAREQDFQSWALANFKGEIGQQLKWMTDQVLIGGELENIEYTVPEDMSTLLPTLMESGTQPAATPASKPQTTTPDAESTTSSSGDSTKNDVAATEKPQTEQSPSMSAERIKSIRAMLSQNGTDTGMLRLLETDKEAANWLLEHFDSPAEIAEWLSKQATAVPRLKPTLPETLPQPLPQEIRP